MLVFQRLTPAALETDRNIVVTTDLSGETAVPFLVLPTASANPIPTSRNKWPTRHLPTGEMRCSREPPC